jgi:hypothetical protein
MENFPAILAIVMLLPYQELLNGGGLWGEIDSIVVKVG